MSRSLASLIVPLTLAAGCRLYQHPCASEPWDACELPRHLPPAEVDDWDEFLATASALVCISALRDEGNLASIPITASWCHPGFAALYVRRAGGTLPPFPTAAARRCLEVLERTSNPVSDGWNCLALTRCDPLTCCGRGGSEGAACDAAQPCLPTLSCEAGVCRPPCDPTCATGEVCEYGVCVEPCGGLCAETEHCIGGRCVALAGTRCTCDEHCLSRACVDGRCTGVRPIGCACTRDAECPADVSRCVAGRCVPRPMLGEPCVEGAPCFGSACVDGTCARIPEGETGCADDGECAPGLRCIAVRCGLLSCETACVAPTTEGGPCALGTTCLDGLACRAGRCERAELGALCTSAAECAPTYDCVEGACAALAARDEPCGVDRRCSAPFHCTVEGVCGGETVGDRCPTDRPCGGGLTCVGLRCVEPPGEGEACGGYPPCAAGHVCLAGICHAIGAIGEPCVEDSCVRGAYCDAGRCAAPAGLGEACADRPCVGEARCEGGVCLAPICD